MNNDLVFRIFKRTLIFSLFIILLFFLVFKQAKPYISGYIFGVLISMAAFKLLHNSVNKSVTMTPNRAKSYANFQYLIRFLIYGIVLIVAAKADYLNFMTTFLGLIMVKLVIVSASIFDKDFLR